MEIGKLIKRRKKEDDDKEREESFFDEPEIDPDSDLPVKENLTDNKRLRKIRK